MKLSKGSIINEWRLFLDYSEYFFVLFRYFLIGGYHESYYLEITQIVGSTNIIHAANAKNCIVNSDTSEKGHTFKRNICVFHSQHIIFITLYVFKKLLSKTRQKRFQDLI